MEEKYGDGEGGMLIDINLKFHRWTCWDDHMFSLAGSSHGSSSGGQAFGPRVVGDELEREGHSSPKRESHLSTSHCRLWTEVVRILYLMGLAGSCIGDGGRKTKIIVPDLLSLIGSR